VWAANFVGRHHGGDLPLRLLRCLLLLCLCLQGLPRRNPIGGEGRPAASAGDRLWGTGIPRIRRGKDRAGWARRSWSLRFSRSLIRSLIRLSLRASAETHRLRSSQVADGRGPARTLGRTFGKRVGVQAPQEFESRILRHADLRNPHRAGDGPAAGALAFGSVCGHDTPPVPTVSPGHRRVHHSACSIGPGAACWATSLKSSKSRRSHACVPHNSRVLEVSGG